MLKGFRSMKKFQRLLIIALVLLFDLEIAAVE